MTNTFTTFKINIDGTFSHKEHMNNIEEVNEWIVKKNFANFAIQSDRTSKIKRFTWNEDNAEAIGENI